ncbi:MAG: hypothetical protein P8M78_03185 [Myxococcota bacterium]|nr:hypothetical protein [Myxococcota bacterium]
MFLSHGWPNEEDRWTQFVVSALFIRLLLSKTIALLLGLRGLSATQVTPSHRVSPPQESAIATDVILIWPI